MIHSGSAEQLQQAHAQTMKDKEMRSTTLGAHRGSMDKSSATGGGTDSASRILTNTQLNNEANLTNEQQTQMLANRTDRQILKEMQKRTNRSILQNHQVMSWLRNMAKAPEKMTQIKERYYRRTGEILADKQITEMFRKLDKNVLDSDHNKLIQLRVQI